MINFQIVSILGSDKEQDESESDEEELNIPRYQITLFGRSADNKAICVKTLFNPYFFVEIPETYTNSQIEFLKTGIRKCLYKNSHHIKSVNVVSRKKFNGFTNRQEFKFLRYVFYNHASFKRVMYALRKPMKLAQETRTFNVYEANIDPMLRFCHVQNLQTAGWVQINKPKTCDMKETFCDEEYTAIWNKIEHDPNPSVSPLVQASFDIETYSADGSFPDPKNELCACIQIATTLQRYGESEPYKKQLLSLGTCNPIEGVEVIECKTEKELLNKWTQLVQKESVDILIGYNIWGFDLWYMITRAEMVDAEQFFYLGRYKDFQCTLRESSFSSSAYGHTDYKMVDTPGRFQLDLLVVMKREHKLTSYSLNNVAEHFLKDKKVDMPYKEMFAKFKQGPEERREIGVYCVKDTDLPLALINKLAIVPNMVEMAKATWVPLSFLIERGQGIKVFSQLLYQTRTENMLVITLNKTGHEEQEPYEGATVLTAKKGAYMEIPITGLDFASLYPTIMRAHNLCHSTLVMDPRYENVPGIEYKEVTIETKTYKFAQGEEGIFPKMLRTLAANRKAAKKEMALARERGDTFMESVYNGKQLAFKVSMNSMYGFCGANLGLLPCKPVASCTTSIGRGMIEHTKNKVEEWYPGADVVYGDSVTGDTPILLKKNNTIFLETIDNIALSQNYSFMISGHDKESSTIDNGLEVYTDKGWTRLIRVIRHKLDNTKQIFRVNTGNGCVDVTSDHSLLLESGEAIQPRNLNGSEKLLHCYPKIKDTSNCDNFCKMTNNKLEAAQAYLFYKMKGKNISIETFENGSYYLHTTGIGTIVDNSVKSCKIIDDYKGQYVYDLTTENHHFQAGIGSLIVHNTDSVMVKFDVGTLRKEEAIQKSFELGEEAADRISATFKAPIELEFEKVYLPYLLFSKKRYAGLMYTDPKKPDYIDAKGIQLVRRDNCPFVKEVSRNALDAIMYNLDTEKAFQIAKEGARRLLNYQIPISQLVVSKSLKKINYNYKSKTKTDDYPFLMTSAYANQNQPHLTVAMKQETREKGYGPKSGDRVPYIFLDTGNKKDLQYKKAEDPEYAIKHNLKVDVEYYMDHGLRSPLESLFEVFVENPKDIFSEEQKIFHKHKNKQKDIWEFLQIT